MKKFIFIFLILCFSWTSVLAFGSRKNAKEIAEQLPELNSIDCSFTQKRFYNEMVLNSGGNFKFIKDKGVIFETTYPIQMVTTYDSPKNKHINEIILAVTRKDYTYLDKNFDIDYARLDEKWQLVLNPKKESVKSHLNGVIIDGSSVIDRIFIDTVNSGKTEILFICGK